MNETALKEKALMAVVGTVVLYALAVGLWFMTCESSWKKASKQYARASKQYAEEEQLIAEKDLWDEQYEIAKAEMPMFGVGKATDTVWLRKVEELAKTNMVYFSKIDHDKEIETGDILELPIKINGFECHLQALVHFMYALENTTEGMFNIGSISLKPSNKPGYLKGDILLTCAYMREN